MSRKYHFQIHSIILRPRKYQKQNLTGERKNVQILKKLSRLFHSISSQNNVYFSFLWHSRVFRLKMAKCWTYMIQYIKILFKKVIRLSTFNDFRSIIFFRIHTEFSIIEKKTRLQRLAELLTDNSKLGDNFTNSICCCFLGKVDSL